MNCKLAMKSQSWARVRRLSYWRTVRSQWALVLKPRGSILLGPVLISIVRMDPRETYVEILWLQDTVPAIGCRSVYRRMRHRKRNIVDHPAKLIGVIGHVCYVDPTTLYRRIIVQCAYRRRPMCQIRRNMSKADVPIFR